MPGSTPPGSRSPDIRWLRSSPRSLVSSNGAQFTEPTSAGYICGRSKGLVARHKPVERCHASFDKYVRGRSTCSRPLQAASRL
jgi:hypothetical protein